MYPPRGYLVFLPFNRIEMEYPADAVQVASARSLLTYTVRLFSCGAKVVDVKVSCSTYTVGAV
jgi:hypothetical protein